MAIVLDGETEPFKKQRLWREVLEDGFAFLETCRKHLTQEEVAFLDLLKAHEPYTGFLANVMAKIKASRMQEALAEARRPHVDHQAIAWACGDKSAERIRTQAE